MFSNLPTPQSSDDALLTESMKALKGEQNINIILQVGRKRDCR